MEKVHGSRIKGSNDQEIGPRHNNRVKQQHANDYLAENPHMRFVSPGNFVPNKSKNLVKPTATEGNKEAQVAETAPEIAKGNTAEVKTEKPALDTDEIKKEEEETQLEMPEVGSELTPEAPAGEGNEEDDEPSDEALKEDKNESGPDAQGGGADTPNDNPEEESTTTESNSVEPKVEPSASAAVSETTTSETAAPQETTAQTADPVATADSGTKTSSPANDESQEAAAEDQIKIDVPDKILPAEMPRMDKAVDSELDQIAPNADINNNLIGLIKTANELRTQGQDGLKQAATADGIIDGLEKKAKTLDNEVKASDEGIVNAENNIDSRNDYIKEVEKGEAISISKADTVGAEAGTYQKEAKDNTSTATKIKDKTTDLAGGSAQHQDKESKDSGTLAKKLNSLKNQAITIFSGMMGGKTLSDKLAKDAKDSKLKNALVLKKMLEARASIKASKTKLKESNDKNTVAKAKLGQVQPKLKDNKTKSADLKAESTKLIYDSYAIVENVKHAQGKYYTEASLVKGKKFLKKQEQDKVKNGNSELSEEDQLLLAFTELKDPKAQKAFIKELTDEQAEKLFLKVEDLTANIDADKAAEEKSVDENVDGLRNMQVQDVDKKRSDRLKTPLDIATSNLDRLSGMKRIWMALSMGMSGAWNSITSITWTDIKGMAIAMINPLEGLKSIGNSLAGIWTDLSDWKGFKDDPWGIALTKATAVSNKVLAITGVVTGILGVLTVAAAVGSFFTLGALAPLAAWLGGATATMGTVTFWVGLVATSLNVLNGIKNIYDINTADTAENLYKNSAELNSDITNAGTSIMAMVGAKATVKGGNSVKALAKKNPVKFGRIMWSNFKGGLRSSARSIKARVTSLFTKQGWTDLASEFRTAFTKRKNKLFGRNTEVDIPDRSATDALDTVNTPDASKIETDAMGNKTHTHRDVPEVEPGLVAKKEVIGADGNTHHVKVKKNGEVIRCSVCGDIEAHYGAELDLPENAHLKKELDAIRLEPDPNIKAQKAQKLSQELEDFKKSRGITSEHGEEHKLTETDGDNTTPVNSDRPTPQQSELDALSDFPEFEPQVSYKNGKRVEYGTRGSSRPEGFSSGPPPRSIEVKNYNVGSSGGRSGLYEVIQKQYRQRLGNLPKGTIQDFVIDIRGQVVSEQLMLRMKRNILTVTSSKSKVSFIR